MESTYIPDCSSTETFWLSWKNSFTMYVGEDNLPYYYGGWFSYDVCAQLNILRNRTEYSVGENYQYSHAAKSNLLMNPTWGNPEKQKKSLYSTSFSISHGSVFLLQICFQFLMHWHLLWQVLINRKRERSMLYWSIWELHKIIIAQVNFTVSCVTSITCMRLQISLIEDCFIMDLNETIF